jgi:molecular chaperone HtpG
MLLGLREYKEFPLQNVADSDLVLPEALGEGERSPDEEEEKESLDDERIEKLISRFREILGDRVAEVRITDRLTNSVARLVDAKGSLGQEMQRVYRMMDREYQIPKKILEINPSHNILKRVSDLQEDDPRVKLIVEQIFDSTLLIEGLHPDPAAMIPRIQKLIESILDGK